MQSRASSAHKQWQTLFTYTVTLFIIIEERIDETIYGELRIDRTYV